MKTRRWGSEFQLGEGVGSESMDIIRGLEPVRQKQGKDGERRLMEPSITVTSGRTRRNEQVTILDSGDHTSLGTQRVSEVL